MAGDAWNVEQYERFKQERAQPFYDLLALIEPIPGMRVVDLGCGTGELTAELHEQLGAAWTLGVDRSQAMLQKASGLARANLAFVQRSIEELDQPGAFDLVFSNAALQWVANHERLFERVAGLLRPGGQLAVQVPKNMDHPSQAAARDVACREPYASLLPDREVLTVLEPEAYAVLLDRLGFERVHVRLQVYLHHLASRDEVVEWSKGTLLTDYKKALPEDLYERYLEDYRDEVRSRLEDRRPYPFTFKRVLMWAVLGEAPDNGRTVA